MGAPLYALDATPNVVSQLLREWKDREGRRSMLPWSVDDDSHEHMEYYEYSRAWSAKGIKLIANYKEIDILKTQHVCHPFILFFFARNWK
jgi:hypothetical protein